MAYVCEEHSVKNGDCQLCQIDILKKQITHLKGVILNTSRKHLESGMIDCVCPCCIEIEESYKNAKDNDQ